MTIVQHFTGAALGNGETGTTVMFSASLNVSGPEEGLRAALAEAGDCFGSDAALNLVGSHVNPPDRYSLFDVAAVVSTTSPQIDEHVGAVPVFVTANSMRELERRALLKASGWFRSGAVLCVVSSRVEKTPEWWDIKDPFLGRFYIAEGPRPAAGTRTCVLTLEDVITGNDIQQMERRARHEGRQFFGPDAEFRVRFRDVSTTPERLGTTDRFFSMFVEVEAVLSCPPQFDERPCTRFPVESVTGKSMRQIERRAVHKARQFFGPGAEYRAVFKEGVRSTPSYIETEDRFYARSVVVEVLLNEAAQADEPAGERVLTLFDTIRGNSRRELERNALREAKRRLRGRVAPGAELRVRLRDGSFGAASERRYAAASYYAAVVDVYISGHAA
ncbi:hypothetical protein [Actinomadura sp. NPDC049753]|uniref:hypothetical protein n=1 Tax=Actinomadura sp. NPDC049753 TaxID=3154739 RepID=UPI003447B138